ncbi:MAG TPA: phosphoribosyltransferase [Longimicrobium sp.]|nr:phosphoribosyltransferase [Longimicrobium sp.]
MQSYDYARRDGVENVSWDRFLMLCRSLAEPLANRGIDTVVGVARAGLLPATMVACSLRCDLVPVRITRRSQDQVVFDAPVWKVDVSPEVRGKRVAVVDEIADTGKTLHLVAQRVLELGAQEVVTAVLVSHSWANPRPQLSGLVSDALVLFPWDQQVLVQGHWQMHPELVRALALQADVPPA